jgi:hypothetical protein
MDDARQFPFKRVDAATGDASLLPMLPLSLAHAGRTLSVEGLVDTGSAVNVLPFEVGVALGADWQQQAIQVRLTGNLAREDARVLVVSAIVGDFPPVRLAFAWTKARTVPVILGQVNFFMAFDACFFRSQGYFTIRPSSKL